MQHFVEVEDVVAELRKRVHKLNTHGSPLRSLSGEDIVHSRAFASCLSKVRDLERFGRRVDAESSVRQVLSSKC